MSDYRPLRPVQVQAAPDTSGKNSGNLTCHFDASALPNANVYEIYHMAVTGAPPFASANIIVAGKQFSYVQADINGGNEWDPAQPAKMFRDTDMYFLWQIAAGGQAPTVVVWPQYDRELPENRALAVQAGG